MSRRPHLNANVIPSGRHNAAWRLQDFVEVVVKLWDSWDDDALMADAGTGVYVDFDRVHQIDHLGWSFSVRGPLNVPRSPQGRPVRVQAGASDASQRLGSRWADALFTVQRTLPEAQAFCANVKALATGYRRDPDGLIVLPGLYPVIGSAEVEVWARKNEMDALLDIDQERLKLAERFGIDAERLHLDCPFSGDTLDRLGLSHPRRWSATRSLANVA